MRKFALFCLSLLLAVGCGEKADVPKPGDYPGMDSKPNGIWVWSSHLDRWIADDCRVLREMKQLGYEHILLNYNSFEDAEKAAKTRTLIAAAVKEGVNVHAWMQCFYADSKWINPIEDLGDGTGRYKQELFDQIISRAHRYIDDFGVNGIHLDYIRFSGVGKNAAYKNNYSNGVTASGAVNEFCRQLRKSLDERGEKIIVSAAMMAESGALNTYGQDAAQMGRYVDILMPMVYRYHPNYTYDESWMKNMCSQFTSVTDAQVWAGIQTYDYVTGTQNVSGLEPGAILYDANVIRETDCSGLVLFRYGLGEFPDVSGLWE